MVVERSKMTQPCPFRTTTLEPPRKIHPTDQVPELLLLLLHW
jgi:hypothetical protein